MAMTVEDRAYRMGRVGVGAPARMARTRVERELWGESEERVQRRMDAIVLIEDQPLPGVTLLQSADRGGP